MKPLLSVIMPTYNGERFVSCALESIRAQHDSNLEVIVVDDGSTDRTIEIVQGFASTLPIRIVTSVRMGNWVAVTNIGLRAATGEWACFLHQDDYWLPGRLARLRREIAAAKGVLVLHNAVFVSPNSKPLGKWTCPLPEGTVDCTRFIDRLLVQNFIAIPSPLFRREAAIDGLDESLWFSADWDLWLRLGAMGPVRFINEPLAAFRIHPESQTASKRVRDGEWEQQLTTVLNRHFPREKRNSYLHRVAKVSVSINSTLSAKSRGQRAKFPLRELASLGPLGVHKYLRDSRIVQRVVPRLRVK